ncbi:MAG: DUF3861 domain-containing protein [Propionivibrio sp.]
MKNHRYAIKVEPVGAATPGETGVPPSLRFHVEAHDEILALVERSRQRGDFDTDAAAAFTVGLKLLGEVMLKNRNHPLFEEFGPQFGNFMKRLKGNRGAPTAS